MQQRWAVQVGLIRLYATEKRDWSAICAANQQDMALVDGYPGFLNHFPPFDGFSPDEGRKVGGGTT